MVIVKFTSALKRFYPDLSEFEFAAKQVIEVLNEVEHRHPGFKSYIVDDQGQLRQHVNIFVDGNMLVDRETLTDELQDKSEVYFFQALSGG